MEIPALNIPVNTALKKQRIHSLDYLRGFAALGIMAFHYISWTFGYHDSSTVIGRIGIYGVSIFYVLSGLTMFIVYKKMSSAGDTARFFVKRIFRIFPLLWIATILTAILYKIYSPKLLVLNLTGLFGFIRWDAGLADGVWSIGNELVFYVMLPFLIFSWRKKLLLIPFIILFGLYIYFSFFRLTPALTLAEQWRDYLNPLNQAFLFFAGFAIGALNIRFKSPLGAIALVAAIAAFVFYPASGDQITIVTGIGRLIFTGICILICIAFYGFLNPAPLIHGPLAGLGEASYSLYLLHPLVFHGLNLMTSDKVTVLILSVPLSILGSYFVYHWIETWFINKGAVVAGRIKL